MDFFNYLAWLPGIFLHPLKSYSDFREKLKEAMNPKHIMYSIAASIIGNLSLAISNMLVNNTGTGKAGFVLLDLLFSIITAAFAYFFTFAVIYFILFLLGRKIDRGELGVMILSSDFLFVVLLPAAIILSFFPAIPAAVSGLLFFVILIMNIVLKIRAISLCSPMSSFGSLALFFTPLLFGFIVLLTGLSYAVLSIFKLLSY